MAAIVDFPGTLANAPGYHQHFFACLDLDWPTPWPLMTHYHVLFIWIMHAHGIQTDYLWSVFSLLGISFWVFWTNYAAMSFFLSTLSPLALDWKRGHCEVQLVVVCLFYLATRIGPWYFSSYLWAEYCLFTSGCYVVCVLS